MTTESRGSVPPARHAPLCPKCGAPAEVLKLLTSMARYFVCPVCAARWQVRRDWDGKEREARHQAESDAVDLLRLQDDGG